jgi:hypothetical protein
MSKPQGPVQPEGLGKLKKEIWVEGFLATDPEVRVPFSALPDFLRSVSGTRSTQPREYK